MHTSDHVQTAASWMRYERLWSMPISPYRVRSLTPLLDERFVVLQGDSLEIMDTLSGETLVRAPVGPDDRLRTTDDVTLAFGEAGATVVDHQGLCAPCRLTASSVRAAGVFGDTAVTACATGALQAFACRDGAERWLVGGGSEQVGRIEVGTDVVVVSYPGRLVARCVDTGTPVWRVRVPYERVAFRLIGDSVIVVADNPLASSSVVGVLGAADGVWKRRYESTSEVRAVGWAPSVGASVLVTDDRSARLMMVNAVSGVDWNVPLAWDGMATKPRCRVLPDGVVVAAGNLVACVRPEGERWRYAAALLCATARSPRPWTGCTGARQHRE